MPGEADNMNPQNQSGEQNGQQGQNQAPAFDYKSAVEEKYHGVFESKGWKSVNDVMNSYTNLENMMGAKDRVILPKDDDQKSWDDVFTKLGRPAKAEEYKFEDIEGVQRDESVEKWFRQTAHSLGLSQKQAAQLEKNWNLFAMDLTKQRDTQFKAEAEQTLNQLKAQWGDQAEPNMNLAKSVAQKFFSEDALAKMIDGVGMAPAYEALIKIGKAMGEDNFVQGDTARSGAGGMSASQAQGEINNILADPDYLSDSTNPARHKMLVAKMQELMGLRYPDQK